jgi:ribosomal protein S18 acetylase RimI-like enzyme
VGTRERSFTIRAARAEDRPRCQEIAVDAWRPIYAARREQLGDGLFGQLFGEWEAQKAGQIAGAFRQHPDWILVACLAPPPAPVSPVSRAAPVSPEGPAEGGPLVGFVTYQLDEAALAGTIGNNAVDPRWQGRGIATALYRQTLEVFRQAGMRVARVTTGLDPAHSPARAAYRRAGFEHEVPSVTLYREL